MTSELGFLNNGAQEASEAAKGSTQSNGSSEKSPTQSSDPLDQITELLREDEENGQETTDEVQPVQTAETNDQPNVEGEQGQEEAPKTGAQKLRDLVDELGTSFETVYKEMQIPMANGQAVSLGELKDNYQAREDMIGDVVESREALATERTEIVKERQFVEMLTPYVAEVPEEVKAQVQEQYQAKLAREGNALHHAIPELRDQNNFAAFRDDMVEHMGQFGFQPNELTMTDHRLILALKQAMDDRKFITGLRKKPAIPEVKKVVKKTPAKPTRDTRSNSRDDQIDQVTRLLGN